MVTHVELIKRAEEMGYEVDPTLSAELLMLASVPDDKILREARRAYVMKMANDFKVPVAAMDARLGDSGPFLPPTKEPLE